MKHVLLAVALFSVQGQGSPAPEGASADSCSVEEKADSLAASGSPAEVENPAVSYVRSWRCTAGYRFDRRPYHYSAVASTRSGAADRAMGICWAHRIPHRLSSPCRLESCVPEY